MKRPKPIAKQPEDIELSDPELREIENMASEDELHKLENSGSVDLDALERELNEMEEGKPPAKPQPKPSPLSKPINLQQSPQKKEGKTKGNSQENLEELEQEFHGLELMFGDMLEKEIEAVVPSLKARFEKNEDQVDYFLALSKKENELLKFQMTITERVKKGEIDEQKYIVILEKMVEKNKAVLQRAKQIGLSQEQISRIIERLKIGQQELAQLKGPTSPDNPSKAKSDLSTQPDSQTAPSEKTQKSDAKPKVEEQAPVEPKPSPNPVLIHFAQKISFFMCFQDHLKKHFKADRAKDIELLDEKIKGMKSALEKLKEDPSKRTIQQLDKEFPNLEPAFIIGMDRLERNKIIEKIIADIQADIRQTKSVQLLDFYKQQYTALIGKLVQVRDSAFGSLPVVAKRAFPIAAPANDMNKAINSGELVMRVKKISGAPAKRYFYLSYEFKYEGKKISDETKFCNENGFFGFEKKYALDDGRISKRFASEKILFVLHKKKYLVSSRLVSNAACTLDKLKNYRDFKISLEFDYKNNTKLTVDLEFSVHKALEKPMIDLQLYVIEKAFPIFSLTHETKDRPSSPDQRPRPNAQTLPANVTKPELKDPVPSSPRPTEPLSAPSKPESRPRPGLSKEEEELEKLETAKFRFPILKAPQKKALAALVAKNNLPSIYLDYQDKIFCVTFLEELLKELDVQINQLAMQGDSETRKSAEEIMMNASKYSNYLNSKLQSGEMSTADYKSKLDNFIKLDQANLVFFEKINFADSVTFIKNRLAIMKEEVEDLQKILSGEN